MAKPTRKISAKELAADVRNGMTDGRLREKYAVSQAQLESLVRKVVESGLLEESDLEGRNDLPEPDDAAEWLCPSCGKPRPRTSGPCPECGEILPGTPPHQGESAQPEPAPVSEIELPASVRPVPRGSSKTRKRGVRGPAIAAVTVLLLLAATVSLLNWYVGTRIERKLPQAIRRFVLVQGASPGSFTCSKVSVSPIRAQARLEQIDVRYAAKDWRVAADSMMLKMSYLDLIRLAFGDLTWKPIHFRASLSNVRVERPKNKVAAVAQRAEIRSIKPGKNGARQGPLDDLEAVEIMVYAVSASDSRHHVQAMADDTMVRMSYADAMRIPLRDATSAAYVETVVRGLKIFSRSDNTTLEVARLVFDARGPFKRQRPNLLPDEPVRFNVAAEGIIFDGAVSVPESGLPVPVPQERVRSRIERASVNVTYDPSENQLSVSNLGLRAGNVSLQGSGSATLTSRNLDEAHVSHASTAFHLKIAPPGLKWPNPYLKTEIAIRRSSLKANLNLDAERVSRSKYYLPQGELTFLVDGLHTTSARPDTRRGMSTMPGLVGIPSGGLSVNKLNLTYRLSEEDRLELDALLASSVGDVDFHTVLEFNMQDVGRSTIVEGDLKVRNLSPQLKALLDLLSGNPPQFGPFAPPGAKPQSDEMHLTAEGQLSNPSLGGTNSETLKALIERFLLSRAGGSHDSPLKDNRFSPSQPVFPLPGLR